ncbi:MAG: PrsW family glutamic-type intramembrane protease [Desulfobaccales bacterium]
MAHFLWGASGLLISTGMWVWVLRRYDRLQPEPIKVLLWVGLLGGFISIVPAIVFNILIDHFLGLAGFIGDLSRRISLPLALYSAVFVGINEETWKFLATLSLVRKLPEFDEPIDGMIYAMTVALGFAAIENVEYIVRFGPGVLVTRSLLSIPIHLVCGAIWGYGLARARFISKPRRYFKTALPYLLAAAVVHAAFDFCLFLRTWTMILVFPLLLFIVWFANRKLHYLRDQSFNIAANICQHCQKANAAHAKFCTNCGLPLGAGGEFFRICGNCQVRVPHNANFCFKCGHKLPQIEAGAERP